MTPDLEYIQKAFDRYNALCFRGELPGIRLELSRARTYLGRYEEKRPQVRFLGRRFSLPTAEPQRLIRISTAFDLTPEQQDDVIIHEMIHYYLAWKGLADRVPHGPHFRQLMEAINSKFGRHIVVRYKMGTPAVGQQVASADGQTGTAGSQGTAGQQGAAGSQGTAGQQGAAGSQGTAGQQGAAGSQGTAGQQGAAGSRAGGAAAPRAGRRIICVSHLRSGETGVTVCATTRVFYLRRALPRAYNIKSSEWYSTADPFFARYPRSNTPKIYRISPGELEQHLQGAVRMAFKGRIFGPEETA